MIFCSHHLLILVHGIICLFFMCMRKSFICFWCSWDPVYLIIWLTGTFRPSHILCKAAANVSGDSPSTTPAGTSPYERVIETLTSLFPVWVCFSFSGSFKSNSCFFLFMAYNDQVCIKNMFLLRSSFIFWNWQVLLGTIIGIYKPAAVISSVRFCFFDGWEFLFAYWLTFGVIQQVTWLETDLFTISLGFLMLSMGLTLTFEDFRRCLRNPWTVRSNPYTHNFKNITDWDYMISYLFYLLKY